MNHTLLKRVSRKLTAWAGVAVLCSVVALAQDAGAPAAPSQGQPATQTPGPRTDGQIEMDVVHALDASQALKNDLITAATIQSEVTLSGTVSSERQSSWPSPSLACGGGDQGAQQPDGRQSAGCAGHAARAGRRSAGDAGKSSRAAIGRQARRAGSGS